MLPRRVMQAAVATALTTVSCSSVFPDPVVGAQTVLVLTYNPSTASFAYAQQSITTLHDLRTMQGSAASVYANAKVAIDYSALVGGDPTSAGALLAAGAPNAGQPVDFDYFTVKNGGGTTLYPADFDSLNIATSYYNVEQAYLFFEQYNVQLASAVPLYYFPTYSASPPPVPDVTDLGVSDPALGMLVVPPFTDPNDVPPSMQPGVVAYQYAQAVFQQQVFAGSGGLPWLDEIYAAEPMQYGPAMNITRSIRDGFSDFFAAVIVADPDFVHTTGTTIDQNRRLDPPTPRCWSANPMLAQNIATQPRSTYDAHAVGSILSAVLWDTEVTQANLQTVFNPSVVAAMQAFGQALNTQKNQLTVPEALDAIASAISPMVQSQFCAVLEDRFHLQPTDVPHCPTDLTMLGATCAAP